MKFLMTSLLFFSMSAHAARPIHGDDQEVPPIDDTPAPVVAPSVPAPVPTSEPGPWVPPVLTIPLPAAPAYPNDLPHAGYPIVEPPIPVITGYLPQRFPLTDKGGHFLRDYVLQVCQGETPYRCMSIAGQQPTRHNGDTEWGVRIYRKDNGAYLGTVDRNIGEEIERDDSAIAIDAHNRHPESHYVARMEAEKARLEYIAAACATGAVYCTSMASKLPDGFKTLFATSCSAWSGLCMTKVANMKLEYQKRIDYVKQQCANNDQACFDSVSNDGETRARADYERKYGPNSGSGSVVPGERPPHDSVGRPTFGGDGADWYDSSCEHCKITESKPEQDY